MNSERAARRTPNRACAKLSAKQPVLTDELPFDAVDVVFSLFAKGGSVAFQQAHYIPADVRIIDLTPDFRMEADEKRLCLWFARTEPPANYERAACGQSGCFATCIQWIPAFAEAGLLRGEVMVNAISGATGAEIQIADDMPCGRITGNMCLYKAFDGDEVAEINQSLHGLQPTFASEMNLLSYRAHFAEERIFATIVTGCTA